VSSVKVLDERVPGDDDLGAAVLRSMTWPNWSIAR
jgi:hypothetical protein